MRQVFIESRINEYFALTTSLLYQALDMRVSSFNSSDNFGPRGCQDAHFSDVETEAQRDKDPGLRRAGF